MSIIKCKISGRSAANYQVNITNGRHELVADEPLILGGDDTGPSPYDLLLRALAACKVITVQIYAKRKQWPLESVEVNCDISKQYSRDCEECVSEPYAKVDIIDVEIAFTGDLTPEQLTRLHTIADRCPVHRTLTSETQIRTLLVEPASRRQPEDNSGVDVNRFLAALHRE